ncbi:type III secretion system domain-containing protein [Yersinia bercovieri]|nr:type III secretion system domain-containing protein [Yersinia bercovieri]
MILPLTTDIRHLHQLAWQPAKFAHPLWLEKAGVKAEHYHYGRSHALDNALNRVLIRQRKFPEHPLPATLSQQQQYQMAGHQQQQFARYLPPRLRSSQTMAEAIASAGGGNPMQAEYGIVSGPLSGARVSVTLATHGLNIVLSHTNPDLITRLQRMQARWQRQLHTLGFPCLLEVTDAGVSDG